MIKEEISSAERVMLALRRQEPDRVPHFEWLVNPKVRQALAPGCQTHNEFADRMGHDAILVGVHYEKKQVGEDRWLSEWGYTYEYGLEEHGVEIEALSPIKSMEDFKAYTPPDLLARGRMDQVEWAVKNYKGKKAIGVHLNDVFSLPRYLMGMTNLLLNIALEPELVLALVEMSVEVNLKLAEQVAALGVDFVHTGDDYAGNIGPLMSPKHFRQIFYPSLRRVMGGFKELGLMVIKHTDGNLWPILDMIVDSGIDCLDPIDPQGGMSLAEVKRVYGDRIAMKGNVDCVQLLSFGAPAQVVEATKEALRMGAPGGGFILSSSNSIHSGVKPENYQAMMDTLRAFGSYPIAV
ncbi:MAG TPA: uroporphyrinogen decarboxylase family protein [Anaerolineales bacterium]|nr:uroporphyrinogen decarboxylase family protein [Anaerolineales bacterium]